MSVITEHNIVRHHQKITERVTADERAAQHGDAILRLYIHRRTITPRRFMRLFHASRAFYCYARYACLIPARYDAAV